MSERCVDESGTYRSLLLLGFLCYWYLRDTSNGGIEQVTRGYLTGLRGDEFHPQRLAAL